MSLAKVEAVKTRRPKDVVDRLRPIYWFRGLQWATGIATAGGLERRFEPEAIGRNKSGDMYNRNKWLGYRDGVHVPGSRLVARVEQVQPGSARDINHVLWKVLRLQIPNQAITNSLLAQLAPEIQSVLFEPNHPDGPIGQYRRRPIRRSLLSQLLRRASLDALAALTLLLFEAQQTENEEMICEIALQLHSMLLMLGMPLQTRGIGIELYQLYRDHILASVKRKGLGLRLEYIDFLRASGYLYGLADYLTEGVSDNPSWQQLVSNMIGLLKGRYGFDVFFALKPFFGPDPSDRAVPAEILKDFERSVRFHRWGWDCIAARRTEYFPPPELW